ncbi:hypothetical protein BLNAU_9986 [Blattamonas nauphoetae]|uniref:Uncharacterized protein n=1 Tax=Blattamonas nauphoetae TaxID=2049346 RepID=A0ABQ9XUB1_9EUKA|nr:hypothetical protein BLNAU_9986 [Blattamonas nauphoetae]
MHRPISITKNKTDNAEFFRAEVPYKTGSEPEDVWISPNLTHPIAPLPQFTHLLDIATSRIFIGITWDILHVASHHQNQVGGERVDGSTGGVWSLNCSDRFLFTAAERGSHTIRSPRPRIRLYEELSRQSPSSDSEAVGSDTLLLFTMADRVREGAEAVQFVRERWSPSATSMSTEYITDRISLHAITMSLPPTDNKPLAQHKHVHCHDPRLETLLRSIELTDSANQRSLEDEEFEREQKELLEQEKSEKKKRHNSNDLVSSEEGLSGGDDDDDKVLVGLQDTAFRTIPQLFQPSEDDGLKE